MAPVRPDNPPDFFTAKLYEDREHAPHLEQGIHHDHMTTAAAAVERMMLAEHSVRFVVDLGAGDGRLLSLLAPLGGQRWGYDLMGVNAEYARNVRGETVYYGDLQRLTSGFLEDGELCLEWGDTCMITECLEHLVDPHAVVRRIGRHSRNIVASSPARETDVSHDAVHAWAWEMDGYRALIAQGGFEVMFQEIADPHGYGFQLIVGMLP